MGVWKVIFAPFLEKNLYLPSSSDLISFPSSIFVIGVTLTTFVKVDEIGDFSKKNGPLISLYCLQVLGLRGEEEKVVLNVLIGYLPGSALVQLALFTFLTF